MSDGGGANTGGLNEWASARTTGALRKPRASAIDPQGAATRPTPGADDEQDAIDGGDEGNMLIDEISERLDKLAALVAGDQTNAVIVEELRAGIEELEARYDGGDAGDAADPAGDDPDAADVDPEAV